MGNIISHLQQRWTRERFTRHTEQFLPALYRSARRLTRDAAAGEDLVHDTYVKAYQAFDKVELRSEEACRAWLFRIMVNAYRDRYRRQQRSPEVQPFAREHDSDTNVIEAAVSPEPDPEVLLGRKRFSEAVQVAIATLSPEVRLVVTLFFAEGLPYKDIAAIAACPIGTVMSRLARGRRQLQQYLREYGTTPQGPQAAALSSSATLQRHGKAQREGRTP